MMDSSDGSTDSEASTGGSASSGDGFVGAVARYYVLMELEQELGEEERDGRFWKTKRCSKKSSCATPLPPNADRLTP
jgi:hypothetical protein